MNTALKQLLLMGRGNNGTSGLGAYSSAVLAIPNCIAYWPLTQTSGTTVPDATGHGCTGTATNVTWASIAGPSTGMGSAPLFGATSFISLLASALNTAGYNGRELSISLWIKNPGWASAQTITAVQFDTDGSNRNFIRQAGANTLAWFEQAGGTIKNSTTSSGLSANWIHTGFTVSKSGDAKKDYVAGAQVGATITGIGTYVGSLVTANIGRRDTGENWIGYIAHVAVFSRAVTAAQMQILGTAI